MILVYSIQLLHVLKLKRAICLLVMLNGYVELIRLFAVSEDICIRVCFDEYTLICSSQIIKNIFTYARITLKAKRLRVSYIAFYASRSIVRFVCECVKYRAPIVSLCNTLRQKVTQIPYRDAVNLHRMRVAFSRYHALLVR